MSLNFTLLDSDVSKGLETPFGDIDEGVSDEVHILVLDDVV